MAQLPITFSVRAVLFDMDGTLVDSTPVVERTWAAFAVRYGVDPEAVLAVAHGRRTEEIVARFAPAGVDVAGEAALIADAEVKDTTGIVPIPGAPELLDSIPLDRWALVTSAGTRLAEARLLVAGLPSPPVIVSADDVAEGKPSPEGYRTAAARLGVPPTDAAAFEDADAGIRAARASGARTIVVGHLAGDSAEGLTRIADLRRAKVVDVTHELLRIEIAPA